MPEDSANHPLEALSEEDREFVLRMVLASGSLKELAKLYGVSYPTIRARLDKLIGRLEVLLEGRPVDPFSDLLADLMERGEVTSSAARSLRELHRRQIRRDIDGKEG